MYFLVLVDENDSLDNSGSSLTATITDGLSSKELQTISDENCSIPTLSPPSQVYDASLAIVNAVNHNDLQNYEVSVFESSKSINKKLYVVIKQIISLLFQV